MNGHRLCIRLLGELEVVRDGTPVPLPQSKKTRALLAYLAATARSHRRERLCEVFWDLPHDPRGELRWSLCKLRGVLDSHGQRRVLADRQSVRLDLSRIDVDLISLRAALGRDPDALSTQALERAVQTMRGPFLEGLHLPELPTFHTWCAAEREDARLLHARILRTLIRRCTPEAGLCYARDLVALDPYDFDDRAWLIRLLVAQGRTSEAERQVEAGGYLARDLGDGEDSFMQALRAALRHRPVVRGGSVRGAGPVS